MTRNSSNSRRRSRGKTTVPGLTIRLAWKRKVSRKGATARYPRARQVRAVTKRKLLDTRAPFGLLSAVVRPRKQTFIDQRRIPVTMSKPLELEFVLVSIDYATMSAGSDCVKKYGSTLI